MARAQHPLHNSAALRKSCFERKELDMNWNFVDRLKQRKSKVKTNTEAATSQEACLAQEAIQSRRAALRGVVAVGCSLLVPTVFFSSPAAGAEAATPTVATKLPKKNVQYQTQPKGAQKCSTCINYIAESSTCKLVEGPIDPEGWCVLWAKKT
jgi:hypothetical protein